MHLSDVVNHQVQATTDTQVAQVHVLDEDVQHIHSLRQ